MVGDDGVFAKLEVLGGHRWCESRNGFAGSTPETGNHIHREREADQREHQLGDRHALRWVGIVVVWQTNPAKQIHTAKGEDDNPEAEEGLAVEDAPTIGKVGHREELECQSQFAETEDNLHHVEPTARRGHRLEHGGEHGKQRERQTQGECKAEHTDGRIEHRAGGCSLDEQRADDGTGAAERNEAEGECHEEDGEQASGGIGFRIELGGPRLGEGELESTKEGEREDYQEEEEDDVEHRIGGQTIEGRCSEDDGDEQSEAHIDDDDGDAVGHSILDRLVAILGALEEEAYGHRNHWPYAGSDEGHETGNETCDEDVPPRMGTSGIVTLGGSVGEGFELVDDGCPKSFSADWSWSSSCQGVNGSSRVDRSFAIGCHIRSSGRSCSIGRSIFLGSNVGFACDGELVAGRRRTHAVVARHEEYEAFELIRRAGDLEPLFEGDCVLVERQIHIESLVVCLDQFAVGNLGGTLDFQTIECLERELCLLGTSFGDVHRIQMECRVDVGRKRHGKFLPFDLALVSPFHRIDNLCRKHSADGQQQKCERKDSFHIYIL